MFNTLKIGLFLKCFCKYTFKAAVTNLLISCSNNFLIRSTPFSFEWRFLPVLQILALEKVLYINIFHSDRPPLYYHYTDHCFYVKIYKSWFLDWTNVQEISDWPFANLGIGIGIGTGIGTHITNVIISSSIRPMDPNLSRVVT